MKVCYFGIYNPEYARNRVLIRGLKENGVEVLECRVIPKIKYSRYTLKRHFLKQLIFLRATKQLIALRGKYDIILVAFPGHQLVWLTKLFSRKKIVYDAFISLYDTYVFDRRLVKEKSLKALYYFFIDWLSCKLADKILLDTNEHIKYFTKTFGIREEKFKRIFVGSDNSIFYPRNFKKKSNTFLVHFHGKYIPLQGVEYIVKAAKLLKKENIQFNLVGNGQTYQMAVNLSKKLDTKNVNFIDLLPQKELVNYIAQADVCLGVFGATSKAKRIIPNKAYEAIAMKKPLITADSPAARELFQDRKHCLFCKIADSEDLAKKILELKNNPDLRNKIAECGYKLYKNRLTSETLGGEFKKILIREI